MWEERAPRISPIKKRRENKICLPPYIHREREVFSPRVVWKTESELPEPIKGIGWDNYGPLVMIVLPMQVNLH